MIDKLYQLIAESARRLGPNWPVIFANQNMPRPKKPYISLNVTNVEIPDHVIYIGPTDANFNETVYGWRKATIDLQVYNGIESLSTVNTLALILQATSMVEFQTTLDVSIGQRLFIGYVPEIVNASQFEGRGIYQFEFFYTESYTENLYDIAKVETHGNYTGSITDKQEDCSVTGPTWIEPTPQG